jgi:hypothetical protein
LISSSPRSPTGQVGRLFARSIILGTDDEGAGAAKVTLRLSLGLRVGRGSSFVGPFVCAVIMASNFRIAAEMSLQISVFSRAASACVKPGADVAVGTCRIGVGGRALSAAISSLSVLLSACSPSMISTCFSNFLATS